MRHEYVWASDFAPLIKTYLQEIRLAGFKFKIQGRWLERFDEFCYNNGYKGIILTKQCAEHFLYGVNYEKDCTKYRKEILLSNFAKFLIRQGYDSYVCQKKHAPEKRHIYQPYIFNKEELGKIFVAIDSFPRTSSPSNMHEVDPLLFRLLYGCGLRLSEALHLKCKDVKLDEGAILVRHAKNNKDRMVPLAKSLIERFKEYLNKIHIFSSDDDYVFPSFRGGCFDLSTIYRRFRNYLLWAGISHCGRGPRIHDFRHTFAVHCFKKWVLADKNLLALQPYLAAFLGHTDFRGTEYYLRLTADLYPDIIKKTELNFGYLIPEIDAKEVSREKL